MTHTAEPKTKTRKPKTATEPESVTVRYDLHELPTAFHKAGLAGLILQIRHMDQPQKNLPAESIPEIAELTSTTAAVRFTATSAQALFDDLYDATVEEARVKTKWPGEPPKREETDEAGKVRRAKLFVYDVVVPRGWYLLQHRMQRNDDPWLKLYRSMIWGIPRSNPQTRKPFNERSQRRPCSLGSEVWRALLRAEEARRSNGFHLEPLSGALLIGAQDRGAEATDFAGRAEHNLLLHFWPLTTLIYVPQRIDHDGKTEPVGYTLAVPEVADLPAFCEVHPEMLAALRPEVRGFLPAKAAIDIPAQGALAFMESLAGVAERMARTSAKRNLDGVEAVEYLHVAKLGNNVKTFGTGRVAPDPDLVRNYVAIIGSDKPVWGNPIFRSGLLLALLEGKPWYEPMAAPLAERPWEFFCEREDDPKSQRKWLARLFAADAWRKFQDLHKEHHLMNTDAPPGDRQTRPLDLIIHDVAKQYVLHRAESRDPNLPKTDGGATDWRNPKAQKAKADAARDAFLQLRSRRGSAFVEHFTALFGQFGQYLPAPEEFLVLTAALHSDPDRVKTVTLLALSANGYVSGKKTVTEEASQ